MTRRIIVAEEFGRFPSGRFPEDGPYNGQDFRVNLLAPELREHERVVVDLDGIAGLPASFLEEAFGGLVRDGLSPADLGRRLSIETREPRLRRYPKLIWNVIQNAKSGMKAAV